MTRAELDKLKKSLPYGSLKKLSRITKKSPATITHVFLGIHKNQKVINAALKLANEEKEAQRLLSEKIANL